MSGPLKLKEYLKVDNVFSPDILAALKEFYKTPYEEIVQEVYGRVRYLGDPASQDSFEYEINCIVLDKVNTLLNSNFKVGDDVLDCVKYSLDYGTPDLPPHYDGDDTDIIFNYQLESNTVWPLGLDKEVIELQDNSALIFNPNSNIHWRPIKKFEPGEYVKMIFFRFRDQTNPSDYSHLRLSQNSPAFEEARAARKTL